MAAASSSSDKAWQWSAVDFSEGEVVNELFAVRFKTADLANNWKKVVDDCKATLTDSPAKVSTEKLEDKVREVKPKTTTLAQFAASQKAGSWECPACLTRNDNSRIQCLACEGPRPGYEDEVKKLTDASKPPATVMTIGSSGGFKFGSGTSSSGGGGFSFGGGEASGADSTAPSNAGTGGFSFGSTDSKTSSTGGFSFGSLNPSVKETGIGSGLSISSPTPTNGDVGAKSPFGASSGHQFSFSGVKTSPQKPGAGGTSSGKHNESTTSENEYYQDDEADNLYFEPIIPLPDKVDVKTGEEEEATLYSHRAKLYRYY